MAHDLKDNKWRSTDISLSTYLEDSGKVEIVTPNQLDHHESSSSKTFVGQNQSSSFTDLKVNGLIVEQLNRCGYLRPSPIQSTAIPFARLGIDLIAQSKSGTGKTLVFVISALEMIVDILSQPSTSARVLVLAPTREIALQIAQVFDSLTTNFANFNCYKAIGGTKVSENIDNLATSSVVVGTPGRVCCLLEMDLLKAHSIRLLVLDECDKLMDNNFKKQINKLYGYLPENKQVIVTSATMSDDMTFFLSSYMKSPALVRLNADNPALVGILQTFVSIEGHSLDCLNFELKKEPLVSILRSVAFNKCIIFTNYQTRAKYLYDKLVNNNWSVLCISAEMSQKERTEAINSFRNNNKHRILVSTDLTSRGIDIDAVNLVVNIDVPLDSQTYLHRIGRAGRFGSAGIAISIVGRQGDLQRFKDILSQYHLVAQEVSLPITCNLWNTFYGRHNDGRVSHESLFNRFNQGLTMHPVFQDIFARYKQSIVPSHVCVADLDVGKNNGRDKLLDMVGYLLSLGGGVINGAQQTIGSSDTCKRMRGVHCNERGVHCNERAAHCNERAVHCNERAVQSPSIEAQNPPCSPTQSEALSPLKDHANDEKRKLVVSAFLRPPLPLTGNAWHGFIESNKQILKCFLKGDLQ